MDNPVINSNGDKSWWLNGQLHRTDGPAIEYANGQVGWYLYHKKMRIYTEYSSKWTSVELTFSDYIIAAKWSDEQIVLWKLAHEST